MQAIVPDPEDLGVGIKVPTPPRLKQTNLSDFREEGNSDNAAAILTSIEVWNITPVDPGARHRFLAERLSGIAHRTFIIDCENIVITANLPYQHI